MANKYLSRNPSTGRVTEVEGSVTGGTGGDAGEIVALDGSGRIDTSMMPVGVVADTYAGTAGEALAAGDLVFIDATPEVKKASAGVAGADAVGFVLAASLNGASCLVYFEGRNTGVAGLTPGTRYYLSETGGGVTAAPVVGTGKRHQYVGTAVTATSLTFEPGESIVLA